MKTKDKLNKLLLTKENKEKLKQFKELFDNRGHEAVVKRYEGDLLQLEATRSKKTFGWHSYQNGEVAIWVTEFEEESYPVVREFFENFFGMTVVVESPNGFWRLSKKMSKEGE